MNKLIVFKSIMTVVILLTNMTFYAQDKYVETFTASKNMEVEVNATNTNIVFKTWNKNKVEVTAFIDDDSLSKAEMQKYMEEWNYNILGNSKKVVITSDATGGKNYDIQDIEIDMDFLGPLLESIDATDIDLSGLPDIILQSVGSIDFDYEAFKENEEEYMMEFEKQMDENFGPEFEAKMEAWGEQFGKDMEENFGPEFEARMEAWGDQFGKDMEAWGENFAKQFDDNEDAWEQGTSKTKNKQKEKNKQKGKSKHSLKKVHRTIIIKMPKNTKTDVNIRHGELKMANAYNLKATLNYSPFIADNIDGGLTLINAAYAPVIVNNWNQGSINVNYVEDCNIKNVNKINLQAISSDILIGEILKSAIISGSIGDLKINSISDTFSNLDIVLENTDAIIDLPATAYSFYYSGNRSDINFPKSLQLNETNSSGKQILNGYNISSTSDKNVSIRSKFSSVIVQ